ncbi:MAG: hypothetical protein [Caudoviricetes sp.]|nr:MAG: hypothetical protein [Caudoviricetes sp.]
MTDPINHPAHYTTHPSGVEAIEITRWLRGPYSNAFKYVFRGWDGLKDDPVQELRKAIWYLNDAEKFPNYGQDVPCEAMARWELLYDSETDRDKAECMRWIICASMHEDVDYPAVEFLSLAKKLIQDRIASLQS